MSGSPFILSWSLDSLPSQVRLCKYISNPIYLHHLRGCAFGVALLPNFLVLARVEQGYGCAIVNHPDLLVVAGGGHKHTVFLGQCRFCLLYTSDAADDL